MPIRAIVLPTGSGSPGACDMMSASTETAEPVMSVAGSMDM